MFSFEDQNFLVTFHSLGLKPPQKKPPYQLKPGDILLLSPPPDTTNTPKQKSALHL